MAAPHDQIEFEEPRYSTCDCCGEVSTHLVRFVTRDHVAFAVYYAGFFGKSMTASVGLASFGAWEEDSDPADRTAFAFQIWMLDDGYQIGLVDADDSGYRDGFLGRILNRTRRSSIRSNLNALH